MTSAQAQAVISALEDLWSQTTATTGVTPDSLDAMGWFAPPPPSSLVSTVNALKVARASLDLLEGDALRWAKLGHKDSGDGAGAPFTWTDWMSLAQQAEQQLQDAAGEALNATAFDATLAGLKDVPEVIASGAAAVVNPFRWPPWAVGVGILAALWLLRPYVSAADALKG